MRPTIGLIGPESLARALTDRGAQIATAREPKDAARIIRERDDLACVLITGPPDPVLTAWATAVGSRTEVVAVGAGWPGRVLASPVSLESLCDALGLEPRSGDGARIVEADGTIRGLDAQHEEEPAAVSSADESVPPAAVIDSRPANRVPSWARSRPASARQEPSKPPAPWANVVLVVSGRGGVGRTHMAVHLAEVAARGGRDTVVVDANAGPGGLAHLLRVSGLSTVADLAAGASEAQIVIGSDALRGAGGVRVPFASVLAPDSDQAAGPGSSPEIYKRVLGHLVPRADLVVVDAPVWWGSSSPGAHLVTSAIERGAAALVLSDASREGLVGARRFAVWARARTQHVLGVLNNMPSRGLPTVEDASRHLAPATCTAVLPYDETVRLRAARGEVIHPLLRLGARSVLEALGLGAE